MNTTSDELVGISEKAIEQIKHICSKEESLAGKGLRLAVVGGGCSGLSYKIEFSAIKDKDYQIDLGFVKVIVDPKSSIYLKGITLDFQDGLAGKGFVFENPNAKNTCGCGESFSM